MTFRFSLGDTVYYMVDNKMCGAHILSRMHVDNLHEDWTSNEIQKGVYTKFGPGGTYYRTIHGVFQEGELAAHKNELLSSL